MRHAIGALVVVLLAVGLAPAADAQNKSNVVTLRNGDRISGDVKGLDRGRLEFSTDDAGTLYLEWDKLVSVVATQQFEVVTRDGRRFLGPLRSSPPRTVTVGSSEGDVALTMDEVTIIRVLGTSFWRRLDGAIDAGFNYTQSSGVAQLNVNSETVFGSPAARSRVAASFTLTEQDDDPGRDDRGSLEISHLRYPWREWFVRVAGRFESNESLGVVLRSQIGAATGPRLVNSNRAQLSLGAGVVFNDERGVDVDATQNVEALLMCQASYFTYDRPRTTLDAAVQYYPSLSNGGRHRLQLEAAVRREFFKDLFVSLSLYNSYDNRPPNPTADRNDVGVVASIGWTY